MKKRSLCILFLLICVLTLSPCLTASDAEAAQETAVPAISEPVVESDDSLSTGQITTWTCITFGSYPQTEILAAPSDAVDAYAVQEGDFLEDPALYEQLTQASWEENTTEIDGIRYLRMNRDDAVTSTSDQAGHYRWKDAEEWHYFRFDPIRWRVIGLEDEKACLMADKLMDCQPWNAVTGPVAWENSTVRSWLNGFSDSENVAGIDYQGKGFLDIAFSDSERAAILKTTVENKPNSRYQTDCGKDTEDFVFLLSNSEVYESETAARNGFYAHSGKDDPSKRFRSTMYAKCRGAWWSSVDNYKGNSFWFMRTNGYNPESVTYICDFGYIYSRGTISTCEDAGLLPAMWISLPEAEYEPAGTVTSKDIQEDAAQATGENDDDQDKSQIKNPVVVPDPDQPDGKEVTYSLIRFGSYPQSEIVPDAGDSGNAGCIADKELYDALTQAKWETDELELDGNRYLRVSPSPDQASAAGQVSDDSFRYFLYEPLLWRALEVRDGTALLLSHYAVECEPFQKDLADVSWENCTLRSWLNGYGPLANVSAADYSDSKTNFMDSAFTEEEQAAILEYPVRNEKNYYFGMDSGKETADKIFIPAESELFIYDSSQIHGFSPRDDIADRAKQFRPTGYALWKGIWSASADEVKGNVFWITRTTGYTHANVVYVDESGYMYNRGILVTCSDAAVIPALMLDLDSSEYEYAGTCTIGSTQ